jgi:rhamnosyltransferase subunit B
MSRKVVLCTIGSLGDLYPFLALAAALRERGFEPVVATSAVYRGKVEAEGLGFFPIRPDESDIVARLGMDMPQLVGRLMRGDGFLLSQVLLPFLEASFSDALAAIEDAALVITHPLSVGAKLAAELRRVPQVSLVLSPALLLSAWDPPRIGPVRLIAEPRSAPAVAFNRAALKVVKLGTAVYTRRARSFRKRLGLPPAAAVPFLEDGSAVATIGLFSPLLARVQPDYPRRSAIVGSSFYDRNADVGRDPELEAFLAAGAPPVVFTLGSFAVLEGERFFRASIEATRALGRRAVLLAAEGDIARLRAGVGPDVFVAGYVPHSALFPAAAAIVHHGGVGTTAQALRAGKPQLVVPFFGDQNDNAARLRRLGVARALGRKRYTGERATAELRALLEGGYAARAAELAPAVEREDGAAAAAALIAELVGERAGLAEREPVTAPVSASTPALAGAAAACPR